MCVCQSFTGVVGQLNYHQTDVGYRGVALGNFSDAVDTSDYGSYQFVDLI